ncbi:MAG: TolC family protein [bacterium]
MTNPGIAWKHATCGLPVTVVVREKRLMRGFVLMVVCLTAHVELSYAQDRIDLPRAIELALKQNKTLARSVLQTEVAVLGFEAAKAPFGIKIAPGGSAGLNSGHGNATAGITVARKLAWGTEVNLSTSLGKTVSPFDTNGVTVYNGSVNVEIKQPLLRGLGELVNTEGITLAQSRVMEARRLVEMQQSDLVVETVRTYVALLRLKRQKESANESAVRMERLSKLTKAMERRGGTTHIDTLRSELQLGQALAQVESNGQEFDSTMRDFAELLGVGTDATFDLEQVPFVEESLPEGKEAEEIALQNRLDYAQSLQDLKDAERGQLVAENRVLPDLALTLQYQRFGAGDNVADATGFKEHFWFVGLSSSTDIFRREDRIACQQTLVNGEVARRNLGIMEMGIRKQSRQYLLAYKRGIGALGIAGRNLALAKARAVLTRRMFEMGRVDNFSVTDAEMAYLNAVNQLLQSETETTLAGYQLRRALGTLLEVPSELLPQKEAGRKELPRS